jgi:hypothetical protein
MAQHGTCAGLAVLGLAPSFLLYYFRDFPEAAGACVVSACCP